MFTSHLKKIQQKKNGVAMKQIKYIGRKLKLCKIYMNKILKHWKI